MEICLFGERLTTCIGFYHHFDLFSRPMIISEIPTSCTLMESRLSQEPGREIILKIQSDPEESSSLVRIKMNSEEDIIQDSRGVELSLKYIE